MCARIVCTPRDKDGNLRGYSGKNEKPPSLAGVEKFIRAKIAAAAALAVPSTSAPPNPSALLLKVFPGGDPSPRFAATTTEVGGAASETNPVPVNGIQIAENEHALEASPSPEHALEASPSPQALPQTEAEVSDLNATDTTQPPLLEPVTASDD
jgi:hypothetical protein